MKNIIYLIIICIYLSGCNSSNDVLKNKPTQEEQIENEKFQGD